MPAPVVMATHPRPAVHVPKALALAVILLSACAFVVHYVFHYYLNYNPAGFDEFWPRRGWLLVHITSGTVAVLTGPWQFSRRIRQRFLKLHRVLGRVYLIAIAVGAAAAFHLAFTTLDGGAWALGLCGLAVAWVATAGMAYYAIRQRQIAIHREWMVRSYVVTFAFVTFRILYDVPPFSHIGNDHDRGMIYIWACWTLPLLATEVILQLRRMRPAALK
jgi:uncharacterized membrane protein